MGKILLLLIIALVAWWLFKGVFKKVRHDAPSAREVEDMVACARCGVNAPRSEMREEGGRFYCVNNPNCRP